MAAPSRPRPARPAARRAPQRSQQSQNQKNDGKIIPFELFARRPSGTYFYDYSLLFAVIFLILFGLVMIYSASSYQAQLSESDAAFYMMKQVRNILIGFGGMFVVSRLNYSGFPKFARFSYWFSIFLMVLVMFVGKRVNGKRRWLGVGGLTFQPAEVVKIALILYLAYLITKMGSEVGKPKNILCLLRLTLFAAGIVAINNLSSGIIIAGIGMVMIFVATKVYWPYFALGGAGLSVLLFAGQIGAALNKVHLLRDYQYKRILAWLHPESDPSGDAFQVLQGLYAIGSGGITGKGLGQSIQKLGFLPESHNDMIFTIICEELGLVGAACVILIFLFILFRLILIAGSAPDLFGALLVVGVLGHIAIQVVLNIAVATNTIPNTGVSLPFISYGGTSIIFLMMEVGMVLSVARRIRLGR